MASSIEKLTALGQSLWYDNIERRLLKNGEIAGLISAGDIRGMTSNPSIFNNAIAKSKDYDEGLIPMAWAGYTAVQIYEQLAVEDIRTAADLFLPLYEKSHGEDGYVSLEVSPNLANDTEGTLNDARRLWKLVARPNLMIKIPATLAGLPAIRKAIADGINVNVTLIFSIERYRSVMEAYLAGLEERAKNGQPLEHIASVASFFVSRIDTKVDKMLEEISAKKPEAATWMGKLAIANAKLAYHAFREVFETDRFNRLKEKGARYQRPLWASTSTKNPKYADTIYVDTLIGAHTVNTAPPATFVAFRDHGVAKLTVEDDLDGAKKVFDTVEALGIPVAQVTRDLEDEGVHAFADAFQSLLKAVEERRTAALRSLTGLAAPVAKRVERLEKDKFTSRIYAGDAALWTADAKGQAEVKKRLGWLEASQRATDLACEAAVLTDQLVKEGYTHALVLGMGGSSLAPEVMSLVFGVQGKGLNLNILDSTDPAQVREAAARSAVKNTLYIVSSKSGATAEINAFFDYFWKRAQNEVGEKAGAHFIAITDPGTTLEELAQNRRFRKVFHGEPEVGGRYSVLTAFGLVPAALLGVDAARLATHARKMVEQCVQAVPAGRNPALVLGVIVGEAALRGRDKLTIIADSKLASFGAWLEQLLAESSGKEGKGIVPVDGEGLLLPEQYVADRLFVYLRRDGQHDELAAGLLKAGNPLLTFDVGEDYDLGEEFYRWEYATAVACAVLGVNAFDQPDVQDSKDRTKAKIADYGSTGKLDEGNPTWEKDGWRVYVSGFPAAKAGSVNEWLALLLKQAKTGDYMAVNAYLPRNPHMEDVLGRLRAKLQDMTRLATTLGFGPRFLHSTGQLHKGGANNGLFLQITADAKEDLEIPGQGMGFATLERAQALGDYEALVGRKRRILRLHLPGVEALDKLVEGL